MGLLESLLQEIQHLLKSFNEVLDIVIDPVLSFVTFQKQLFLSF